MWVTQNTVESQGNKFNIEETNEDVYAAVAEAMMTGQVGDAATGGALDTLRYGRSFDARINKKANARAPDICGLARYNDRMNIEMKFPKAFKGLDHNTSTDANIESMFEQIMQVNDEHPRYCDFDEKTSSIYTTVIYRRNVPVGPENTIMNVDGKFAEGRYFAHKLSGLRGNCPVFFPQLIATEQTQKYSVLKVGKCHQFQPLSKVFADDGQALSKEEKLVKVYTFLQILFKMMQMLADKGIVFKPEAKLDDFGWRRYKIDGIYMYNNYHGLLKIKKGLFKSNPMSNINNNQAMLNLTVQMISKLGLERDLDENLKAIVEHLEVETEKFNWEEVLFYIEHKDLQNLPVNLDDIQHEKDDDRNRAENQ